MIELYDKGLWTDVKFHCKDHDESKRIHAHKVVLAARSPVFQAMFFGPCASGKNEVVLDNDQADIVDLFLRYIYSDNVTLTEDNAPSVLEMAHYYQVTTLVDFSANYLTTIINPNNACDFLTLAMRYDVTTLRDACCTYIDKNAETVLNSKGFLELSEECLAYILKGDTFHANEDVIFSMAEVWSTAKLIESGQEAQGLNIRKTLGEAFYYLRLPTMTYHTLMACTRKKGYFTVDEYEDIVDFINDEFADSSVKSNSCVARLPTDETLLVNEHDGDAAICDGIATVFQISVSRDVELTRVILEQIYTYLEYNEVFFTNGNSKRTEVTEEIDEFFRKYNKGYVYVYLKYGYTKYVRHLIEISGQDLPDQLDLVISGSFQVKCNKKKISDGRLRDEGCETSHEENNEQDSNESETQRDEPEEESVEPESDDDDEDNGEILLLDQQFQLESTDVSQRSVDLKSPLTLTKEASPYTVTVNLEYSCKCRVKMKAFSTSYEAVQSDHGHICVENVSGNFKGIKALTFKNVSNRENC